VCGRLSTPVMGDAAVQAREAVWRLAALPHMHALTDHLVARRDG